MLAKMKRKKLSIASKPSASSKPSMTAKPPRRRGAMPGRPLWLRALPLPCRTSLPDGPHAGAWLTAIPSDEGSHAGRRPAPPAVTLPISSGSWPWLSATRGRAWRPCVSAVAVAHQRPGVDAADRRRLDLVVHVAMPRSPRLSREGRAQAGAADCDGAALRRATQVRGWWALGPTSSARAALADSRRRVGATMVGSPLGGHPVGAGACARAVGLSHIDGPSRLPLSPSRPGPAVTEGFWVTFQVGGRKKACDKKSSLPKAAAWPPPQHLVPSPGGPPPGQEGCKGTHAESTARERQRHNTPAPRLAQDKLWP